MTSGRPASETAARLPPDASPRVPIREVLAIDGLVLDEGTQVRSAIDENIVVEYIEALGNGAQFPPVVVFRANGNNVLSDGFHRVIAYRKAGRAEIEADVYHGTRDDALWFALGANRSHGKRLTRADKQHAIELAYRAWPDLSQARIANQVGCTQQYVSKVRAQLTTSCELPDRVVGIDGRRRAATRPASPSTPSRRSSAPSSTPVGDEPDARSPSSARSGDSRATAPSSTPSTGPPSEPGAAGDGPAQPPPDPASRIQASDREPSAPAAPGPDPSDSEASSSDLEPSTHAGHTPSRSARDRSNRIVSLVAYDAKNLTAQQDLVVFAALDRARLPEWIADLEEARHRLGNLIRRLREEVRHETPPETVED